MKQLFATDNGHVLFREMPAPALRGTGAILQTKFSAVSVGAESAHLRLRREHPGTDPIELALGNDNAGIIIETGPNMDGFRPGDAIACAGNGYAVHAEQCYVPKNLLALCPSMVDLREAAFAGPGATAMQGLRRAGMEVGETIAIIGMDMTGQLAAQIAKAAGTHVLAVDTNAMRLEVAKQQGVDLAVNARALNAATVAMEFTQKRGVDLVVVTDANPKSPSPLTQALQMVRHRGRVVVAGNVSCDFPRELWEQKDAELLIAVSCDPARMDPQADERGQDYPIGYVRWTGNRNLHEFIRLVSTGQVKVAPLITHEFPFARAADAYDLVLSKPDECLGVVLRH